MITMSDIYLKNISKRLKKQKYIVKPGSSFTFAQLYLMFGGLIFIMCGLVSKAIGNLKDFTLTDSNTLKLISFLHYFIGATAFLEGCFGFTCWTLKSYLIGAKHFYIVCASVFFMTASVNAVIFQIGLTNKEQNPLSLPNKKSSSMEWKLIHTVFHCCGYNSYTDWIQKNNSFVYKENIIPMECCVMDSQNGMNKELDEIRCHEEFKRVPKKPNYIYHKGCKEYITMIVNIFGIATTILCFSFSFVQMLSTFNVRVRRPIVHNLQTDMMKK